MRIATISSSGISEWQTQEETANALVADSDLDDVFGGDARLIDRSEIPADAAPENGWPSAGQAVRIKTADGETSYALVSY